MKKMKSIDNEMKKCKFPGCDKETHNEKTLFCLEHDRDIRDKVKKVGQVGLAIGVLGITAIGRIAGKSKK